MIEDLEAPNARAPLVPGLLRRLTHHLLGVLRRPRGSAVVRFKEGVARLKLSRVEQLVLTDEITDRAVGRLPWPPLGFSFDVVYVCANGRRAAALHAQNGAPLRLVVPGWPGSCSQKWLKRIYLRDIVHDGPKMTGTAYRVPNRPVSPGEKVDKKDFVIIERMPVKSLITNPMTDSESSRKLEVRGHAWSGDRTVDAVDISMDFGSTWQSATLDAAVNDGAWQNWRINLEFPEAGYYEVWARATDSAGEMQPFAINWNPKGYLNNTMHRVAVRVA